MANEPIPDGSHVTRYCGLTKIHLDDGSIDGSAFLPKSDTESVSLNWMEYFYPQTQEEQLHEIRSSLDKKFGRIGAKAVLAILSVTGISNIEEAADKISILHDPLEPPPHDDPSHSGIFGLTRNDDIICELIAQQVIQSVPAKLI